ncbi:MAG: hypothetical protein H7Y17_16785, partial [Chlorobia bacterium]|nr:hypothetical protein [Fimbriimonadaceae bacterium]
LSEASEGYSMGEYLLILIKTVMSQKDDPSKFLVSRLREASEGYSKGETWLTSYDPAEQPKIGDREAFMCLLNTAIQSGVLYDASALSGVRLSDAIKKAVVNPPGGDKLWKLNRDILLAIYPEEVNPDDPGK